MDAQTALEHMGAHLEGLGLHLHEPKSPRRNAQYSFTRKPDKNQWLTVVLWTTVTADGPLTDKKIPIRILVFGNKLPDRCIWIFSETKRFRQNMTRFRRRLRTRANLAIELSESVEQCPRHSGPLPLRVVHGRLAWVCAHTDCAFWKILPEEFSKQVRNQTPKSFWKSRKL